MSEGKGGNEISCGGLFVVFVVFLVLKLTGTIDWSWWYVTMPLWIPLAILLAFAMIVVFIVMPVFLLTIFVKNLLRK